MPAHEIHSRRVGDLLQIVQNVVDEVNDYLKTGGSDPERKGHLMQRQASAMAALTKAMELQHELLAQLKTTKEPMPARRTDDPARGKPNLKTVEDQEIDALRRRAGIES